MIVCVLVKIHLLKFAFQSEKKRALLGFILWCCNGRDEMEIPVKARYDGEYVENLKRSSISGAMMDARCFLGTIMAVMRHDGVVEGGTGEMHRKPKK